MAEKPEEESGGAYPVYALDLSRDGISLLDSRDRAVWRCLDTVPLQVGTLSRNLARLHARTGRPAEEMSPVEVWLPTAEVQVEAVDLTLAATPEDAIFPIFEATGTTPPDALAYDFAHSREDGLIPVAAVPLAVLEEAGSFLAAHGFQATSYTTAEEPEGFGQMPDFGLPAAAPVPEPVMQAPAPLPEAAQPAVTQFQPAPQPSDDPHQPAPAGYGWVVPAGMGAAALLLVGVGVTTLPGLFGPSDTRGLPREAAQTMSAMYPLARSEGGPSVATPERIHSAVTLAPAERLSLGTARLIEPSADAPQPQATALLSTPFATVEEPLREATTFPQSAPYQAALFAIGALPRTDSSTEFARFEGALATTIAGLAPPAVTPGRSDITTASTAPVPQAPAQPTALARRDPALRMAAASTELVLSTNRPVGTAQPIPGAIALPLGQGAAPTRTTLAALDLREDVDTGPQINFASLALSLPAARNAQEPSPVNPGDKTALYYQQRFVYPVFNRPAETTSPLSLTSPENPELSAAQIALARLDAPNATGTLDLGVKDLELGREAARPGDLGTTAPPPATTAFAPAITANPPGFAEGRITPGRVRIIGGRPTVQPPNRPVELAALAIGPAQAEVETTAPRELGSLVAALPEASRAPERGPEAPADETALAYEKRFAFPVFNTPFDAGKPSALSSPATPGLTSTLVSIARLGTPNAQVPLDLSTSALEPRSIAALPGSLEETTTPPAPAAFGPGVTDNPSSFAEGRVTADRVRIIAGSPAVEPPNRPVELAALTSPAEPPTATDAEEAVATASETPALPAEPATTAPETEAVSTDTAVPDTGEPDAVQTAQQPSSDAPAERSEASLAVAEALSARTTGPESETEEPAAPTPGGTTLAALQPANTPTPTVDAPEETVAAAPQDEAPAEALGSTAGLSRITPNRVRVTNGRPSIVPPARPSDALVTILEPTAQQAEIAALVIKSQQEGDLAPTDVAPLSVSAPRARPESMVKAAKEAEETLLASLGPSDIALTAASRPPQRPKGLRVVKPRVTARATPAPAQSTAPRNVARAAPQLPTVASVARAATIQNVLPTREMALIGVFGTSSKRHALVRMPNGRYVKVRPGDTLRGFQVTAISADAIRLRKRNRDTLLVIPQ